MKTKIAIGSWAYTFGPYKENPIPLNTVISEVAKMNFDGISLGGFKPHAHPDLYPTKDDKRKLVKMISDSGLEVSEYSADMYSTNPLLDQNAYFKLLKEFIKFMVDCQFSRLRLDTVCPPVLPEGMDYNTAKNRAIEVFQKAARMADKEGIEVVWEFEPGFIFNKPSEVVDICNQVNDKNFKISFDTCHANMCAVVGARQIGEKETLEGGVLEFLEMLKDKIGLIHLIDSDGTLHDDETSTHAPFGLGYLDFDTIIPALTERANYTGDWWVIDLCFWLDAWNVTKQCKDFVDQLNKKYNG